MTSGSETRTFWTSAGVHAGLIAILLAGSLVRGCLPRPHPHELVTYVAIQEPMPVLQDIPVPPDPTPPDPEPPPPDPPKDIPDPPKDPPKLPKPPPKQPKVQVSTNLVRRTPPQPRPPSTPPKPVSAAQLQAMLAGGKPLGPVGPAGPVSDFPFAWYFALVRKAMYDAWDQPGGLSASAGLRVIVEVRVARDGSILKREILQRSGHPLMDSSVEQAVQRVPRLPPLPEDYRGKTRDIQIAFELTGTVM